MDAAPRPLLADPALPERARQLNLRKFMEHFEEEKHYINAKYYYYIEEGRVKMMNAEREIPARDKVPGQSRMRTLSHTEV